MSQDVIELTDIKRDWYNKGADRVNVHIYVRDVDGLKIEFEENRVELDFYSRNQKFVKLYGNGRRGSNHFNYGFYPREPIVETECEYTVKAPFIEIILKKQVPKKWDSLEFQSKPPVKSKKKGGKVKSPDQSPKKGNQQLLGGKSTPLAKKGNDDGNQDSEVKAENLPSSSKTSTVDKRNIHKTVSSTQVENYAGLTGLENYANNCYMNVVIQLLANIEELKDYLKNDLYIKDINTNNPLCSGGKVVKAFAEVIKVLWSHRKHPFKPSNLKNIMGRRCSLFLGWQQHDAQEFFASLLDNLHEDLNQFYPDKNGEKDKTKSTDGESNDNEKPDTAWHSHIKRNNSFIVKLFHGQLMSRVTCHSCHKVSYSYDPCAQISLPIPSTKQTMQVLFFTRDVLSPPSLVKLQVSTPNAKMWHLVNMLQTVMKVPSHLISVFKGASDVCNDLQSPLSAFLKQKFIIANEVASKDEPDHFSLPVFQNLLNGQSFERCENCLKSEDDIDGKLKRCTRCMAITYCSRECQTKHWGAIHSRVCSKDLKMQIGLPFYVTLRKDLTCYAKLEEILRDRAKDTLECVEGNLQQGEDIKDTTANTDGEMNMNVDITNKNSDTSNKNTDASNKNSDTSNKGIDTNNKNTDTVPVSQQQQQQYEKKHNFHNFKCVIKIGTKMNTNDESATALNNDNFSVEWIAKSPCLILEWRMNASEEEQKKTGNEIRTKKMPNHAVHDTECFGVSSSGDKYSLHDCLKLFMEPERLDESESWKCPKCTSLQSAKKEMTISSPPWFLLLHLKRFTYGDSGQKIHKAISYPLSNLDLSPYIARETRNKLDHAPIYDLCGVITHRGNMRMGHYTCMVRMINQSDQEEVGWRNFDDDCVTKIKNEKVISPDAYVLMYRIRGAHNAIKTERFSNVSNTSLTQQDNASIKIRKRADSASCGKTSSDRRSASEYTLGINLKRSTSIEATNDGNRKKSETDTFSSPQLSRRCTSALPMDTYSKPKEQSIHKNLTSTSMPNVSVDMNNQQTLHSNTNSLEELTGRETSENITISTESLGSFDCESNVFVETNQNETKSNSNNLQLNEAIENLNECVITDMSAVNENDLD